jgi:hypothetical protein
MKTYEVQLFLLKITKICAQRYMPIVLFNCFIYPF